MRNMNHETRNPFAIFPLQGGRLCGRGPGVVRRSPFLAGMALAVVLGSMVALSTPALAMGGGGGGGGGSAPAPKVTEVNDPVAKPGDEAAGDKIVNKPDERTTEFPKPEAVKATIGFAASASSMIEGGGESHLVEVEISKPLSQPVTLAVVATSGTAVQGTDYVISSGTITIPANTTSAALTLTSIDNDVDGADETITFTLRGKLLPDGVTVGAKSTHTVTIIDDDIAGGIDVVKKPEEETPEAAVKPDDDAGDETGTDTEDKTANKPDVTTATVEFAASNPVVALEGETVRLILALSRPLPQEVTLSLHKSAADTGSADDVVLPRTVTFPAETTSAAVDLTVLDDAVAESDETVTLTLRGKLLPDGVAVGAKSAHTITIPANDQDTEVVKEPEEETPEVVVKPDDETGTETEDETVNKPDVTTATVGFAEADRYTVWEGAPPQSLRVALSSPLPQPLTLSLVREGTASASDVTFSSNTVTFSQGQRDAYVDFTVLDDTVPELNETITVALEGDLPDGVTFGVRRHTVVILANDNTVTVSTPSSASIAEEGGIATITVTSNSPIPAWEDAAIMMIPGGNAVRGTDYRLSVSDGRLEGERWVLRGLSSATLTVEAIGNSVDAEDKELNFYFSGIFLPSGWYLHSAHNHVITITDDDVADEIDVVKKPEEETPEVAVKPDDK
ncbi:MAG: hypothetical protein OXE98_04865, partial [Hyphomicrobiales bacterium]|nr:hypothetical protein [Hyphomicrobiales bacterium]